MGGATGAFGKIPGLGDFLRLDLPAGFVTAWDEWLQSALTGARGSLGDRWDECYLSAPIWRFSLPAGAAGAAAVSGIVMPSIDRVGRQYPLTLAATCPPGGTPARHFANAAFFDRLEDIALTALEEEFGRDELAARLSGLAPETAPDSPPGADVYAGPIPPENALAARHVAAQWGETALWSTEVGGDHRLFLCHGLPSMRQSLGLFDLAAAFWQAETVAVPL
ncbi:MAG: type VI secretion system-associated protein TagF [Pseudooceanicola sp.]